MNLQRAQAHRTLDDQLPVMSAKRAFWKGIRLAHFRFRSGEIPEHYSAEHLIVLSLGESCNGEIRTATGFQTRAGSKGNICVIPAGQSYSARLVGESEHLAMFLDPSLVLRAASESRITPSSKVEVIERCAPNDPVINGVGMALLAELESERLGVVSMRNRSRMYWQFICSGITRPASNKIGAWLAECPVRSCSWF